jgi:hypothetical protein
MKYVPENREECKNLSCKVCFYYNDVVKECGCNEENIGFDYDLCKFR